jgi:hypothetical protein
VFHECVFTDTPVADVLRAAEASTGGAGHHPWFPDWVCVADVVTGNASAADRETATQLQRILARRNAARLHRASSKW